MSLMSKNMTTIAVKLNRLDDISKDMSQINTKMSVLKPMLANMQEMNNPYLDPLIEQVWSCLE
jgi:hypothetical protein